MTLKTRGKRLVEVQAALQEAKDAVLSIIRLSKVQEIRRFKGMTRERYKEIHKKEPEEDGLVSFQKRLKSGKVTDAVLLSKQHEDEWDVDFVDEEGIEEKETIGTGEVWATSLGFR